MLPNERTTRNEVAATPGEVEGLVVAPDRESARPLIEFLRAEGINVQTVNSADHGFEEALLHRPNIVLVDEKITSSGGIDLCERLKANMRTHFLPVVLCSHSKQDDLLRLDALAAGVDALFSPATSRDERRARLWALLRSQAIFRKLDAKRQAQNSTINNKRSWVRGLVHDIQNSLGAIQANFEYVAHETDSQSKDLDECLEETRALFREMVRSLRTVLEFERFEAGDVVLKEGKVLLSDLSTAVASALEHLAVVGKKRIVVDSGSYSLPVRGDENYLKEAVTNLATYILKQANNNTCYLNASSEAGISRLRVYGESHKIPVATRQTIFDPYSVQPSGKPARAAHRVGLALAKVIVEVHHGTVGLEDVPHAGTAFVLEFPSHWPGRGKRSPE